MQAFRILGGDPSDEFRHVARRETEEQAVQAAREFLVRAGAGTAAIVEPGGRRFVNQAGSVREVRP